MNTDQPQQQQPSLLNEQKSYYGKKGWGKWVLIYVVLGILVIIITAIAATYFINSHEKQPLDTVLRPTQTPVPTSHLYTEDNRSATANWKTYTNTIHNYLIKYNPDMTIQKESHDEVIFQAADHSNKPGLYGTWFTLRIIVADTKKAVSEEEYVRDLLRDDKCESVNDSSPEYLISSCKFTTSVNNSMLASLKPYQNGEIKGLIGDIDNFEQETLSVIQAKGNKVYKFTLWPGGDTGTPVEESHRKMFDQILSTFKFTPLTTGKFTNQDANEISCKTVLEKQNNGTGISFDRAFCQGLSEGSCQNIKNKNECVDSDSVKIENNNLVSGKDGKTDCVWNDMNNYCLPK